MAKAIAVSIRADRTYIKALNELADGQGKHTADLVREVLDAQLGTELLPFIRHFDELARKSVQSERKKAKNHVA